MTWSRLEAWTTILLQMTMYIEYRVFHRYRLSLLIMYLLTKIMIESDREELGYPPRA
jgi:hypothetical protein